LGVVEDRASGPAAALPRDRRPPGAWGQRAAHPEPSAGCGHLPCVRAATGRGASGPATFRRSSTAVLYGLALSTGRGTRQRREHG